MIRTQISLGDDEMARLRQLAAERNVSIASLLRDAVDRLLVEAESEGTPRQRALAVVGGFRWEGRGRDHDADLVDAVEA